MTHNYYLFNNNPDTGKLTWIAWDYSSLALW
ncbi:MAG: hypothetical protein R2880_13290 [Deinococcales bacterium]